jgi:hypothetical protein
MLPRPTKCCIDEPGIIIPEIRFSAGIMYGPRALKGGP